MADIRMTLYRAPEMIRPTLFGSVTRIPVLHRMYGLPLAKEAARQGETSVMVFGLPAHAHLPQRGPSVPKIELQSFVVWLFCLDAALYMCQLVATDL